jgi:Hom_end-associated Hint/Type III restriction enzyme, res subunit/Homing endonuclease
MKRRTSQQNRAQKTNDFVYKPSEEYRERVKSQSYLGKKGYTIPKSVLEKEDEEFLKKDLFVKPEVSGATYGMDISNPFPVFRENANKLYLPRFYGIERYGEPVRCEISNGHTINVTFAKQLRDYQENIISVYMNHVNKPLCSGYGVNGGGGILEIFCGAGKCLAKNTPVLMYDGNIKLVQDIVVGDLLMGDDSSPRTVLSLARGRETMYKVHETKGEGYTVNESHILSLKCGTYMNKNNPKGTIRDISVKDYLNLPKSYHGRGGPLYGYRVPITFPEKQIEIDPYLFGIWLGDGNSRGTMITTQESTVIKYVVDCFKTKHPSLYLKYTGDQYDYRINSIHNNNILKDFLKKYDLILNKHIPHHYKCNSRNIQLAVLAGLIDSDGHYHQNCYEIIQKNEKLLDDIVFLARSLGFAAFKKKVNKTCTNAPGGPKTGVYYKTNIYGFGLEEIPVLCARKKGVPRKQIKDALNYRIKLEKLPEDDYYGFEIDGNRRFVLGDFTVTHNTVMGLKIISELKKKTLIIVHKEFLMNQWIERIQEFLPDAKVGKIQGQVFDIDDKDIVIGMVQTLYDKDYSQDAFSSFGLTIIDEVHRIGSEQFSRTLFKTITPYMLGISATVERKDKLTKVLYMFIGEKVYSKKREGDDLVCVRGIHYKTNDGEFNETEVDFRGKTKYSTMITKLCDFGPRSDFILKVLKDLIEEEPENQIMILSHNRSLLTYLFEGINHRGIATTGYYVGGMKQEKLQETEGKQIVLATYAMAAEALDIKSLSTLVMVTPKTDIIQSVGRILRVKHENPIVVDIIDPHDTFKNQWVQRRRYYKKCNYRIWETDSTKYAGMRMNWQDPNINTVWKRVYEPKGGAVCADSDANLDYDDSCQNKCLIDVSMFADV